MNKLSLILGASAVLLAGCNPKVLVADYFIPDTAKVVRATLQADGMTGSGDSSEATYSYAMQVCDLSDGVASNCKTTTVLTDILSFSTTPSGGQ